ncbi:hypothetical protein FGB62_41g03 [Gracilaria domingensis]|nr:hypothetical protein FGB62_226g05 [Gracilaria domingensis]KAI0559781.1 hypothetical protein FGB62_137g214 [Gracilaria domingensis]KAI0563357.1 hypothetical protein FGB62_41g03 [Gracilaria domingensis]
MTPSGPAATTARRRAGALALPCQPRALAARAGAAAGRGACGGGRQAQPAAGAPVPVHVRASTGGRQLRRGALARRRRAAGLRRRRRRAAPVAPSQPRAAPRARAQARRVRARRVVLVRLAPPALLHGRRLGVQRARAGAECRRRGAGAGAAAVSAASAAALRLQRGRAGVRARQLPLRLFRHRRLRRAAVEREPLGARAVAVARRRLSALRALEPGGGRHSGLGGRRPLHRAVRRARQVAHPHARARHAHQRHLVEPGRAL